MINRLSAVGLPSVEVASFVSPSVLPLVCVSPKCLVDPVDATDVLRSITRRAGVRYPLLSTPQVRLCPIRCATCPQQLLQSYMQETCTYADAV